VFIISITGCLYAFQAEIQSMIQPYRYVAKEDRPVLPPSALQGVAERALPGKKVHAVLYAKPGKAAQVIFYDFDPEYYYLVYLNPYDGTVLKVKNEDADFFRIVLMGHFYLWLPPDIGQPLAASATLIFLAMLITGLIMWWPRNKKSTRQRFTIKWNARWRRVNYDLHAVMGFYATWIAIILAVTGLVFGFQWFARAVYVIAGGEKSLRYEEPVSPGEPWVGSSATAGDRLFLEMTRQYPHAEVIEVHVPPSDSSSLLVTINDDEGTYWKTDYRYFDQYSLEEMTVDHIYGNFSEAKAADKLMRMNYDIHTGAILGLPGKILAFFASLVCASLPVTGLYLWLGMRKSKAGKTDNIDIPAQRSRVTSSSSSPGSVRVS
jgi:uncharacterized iron-regulated membrane protein